MICMYAVADEKQDGEVVVTVEKNKMAAKVVVEHARKMALFVCLYSTIFESVISRALMLYVPSCLHREKDVLSCPRVLR